MGYQLWVSNLTGQRRKGTGFRALKDLFMNNVTVKSIYELLLCCPADSEAEDAKRDLKNRGFDVAGVKETEDGDITGYIVTDELTNGKIRSFLKKIDVDLLISDSTPIAELFYVLRNRDFAFVICGNKIKGIVTKADINKPPVRIYIFGIMSLFEMHLNYWLNHFYNNNDWTTKIPEKRLGKAKEIFALRRGNNQDLSLLECLELCDKRDILGKTEEFINNFNASRESFELFVRGIEKIRNELAHSQNSIISNIKWTEFIEIVSRAEAFLIESDDKVEAIALDGKDFKDMLIPTV
jgi:hypothetical protein